MKSELQRIKIARAIGLTVIDVPFVPATVNCHATGVFFTSAAWSEWMKVYKGGARTLPRYEEDLNAAIQLCDVLAGEGWRWKIYNLEDGGYSFDLRTETMERCIMSSSASLPEAICTGFLRVKGLWTEDTATV